MIKLLQKMKIFRGLSGRTFEIINKIKDLPMHPTKRWAKRNLDRIKEIIIHQELADGTIEAVNNYHITPSPDNHLSTEGVAKFAYHFGITADGEVWQTNVLSDVTFHCKNHNTTSIGIMVVGNFHGPNHTGTKQGPSKKQLQGLENLLNYLLEHPKLSLDSACVYGHSNFGKPACPGSALENFITNYRRKGRG